MQRPIKYIKAKCYDKEQDKEESPLSVAIFNRNTSSENCLVDYAGRHDIVLDYDEKYLTNIDVNSSKMKKSFDYYIIYNVDNRM